jgi:acyl-CoA synthetase (AMP-forming)/AMP-acid ligase II
VAGGLRTAGVDRGDRVAVRYPAGVNWVLAFWGALMAGGIAVAVNTRSSAPQVEFVLNDAGVKVDLAPRTTLPDGEAHVETGLGTPTWRRCSTLRAPPGTPRACRPRMRRSSPIPRT